MIELPCEDFIPKFVDSGDMLNLLFEPAELDYSDYIETSFGIKYFRDKKSRIYYREGALRRKYLSTTHWANPDQVVESLCGFYDRVDTVINLRHLEPFRSWIEKEDVLNRVYYIMSFTKEEEIIIKEYLKDKWKDYEVGQKIWKIQISKYRNNLSNTKEDFVKVEEMNILGISKYKVVFDNDLFTSLDNDRTEGYKKYKNNSYINDISVNIRVNEYPFDDGIFISSYSTIPPNEEVLKCMVRFAEKEINETSGCLLGEMIEGLNKLVEDYVRIEYK